MSNETYEEVQEAAAKRKEQLIAYRKDTGLIETVTPGVVNAEERSVPFEDGEKDSEASQSEVEDDQFFEDVIEAEEEKENEAPKESARKDDWVAYRVQTHGLTEKDAEELTKQELIELA